MEQRVREGYKACASAFVSAHRKKIDNHSTLGISIGELGWDFKQIKWFLVSLKVIGTYHNMFV